MALCGMVAEVTSSCASFGEEHREIRVQHQVQDVGDKRVEQTLSLVESAAATPVEQNCSLAGNNFKKKTAADGAHHQVRQGAQPPIDSLVMGKGKGKSSPIEKSKMRQIGPLETQLVAHGVEQVGKGLASATPVENNVQWVEQELVHLAHHQVEQGAKSHIDSMVTGTMPMEKIGLAQFNGKLAGTDDHEKLKGKHPKRGKPRGKPH